MAAAAGIYPASIQDLYEKIGQGQFSGFTVPAMNLRGISYDMARAAFRAAIRTRSVPLFLRLPVPKWATPCKAPRNLPPWYWPRLWLKVTRDRFLSRATICRSGVRISAPIRLKNWTFVRSLIKESIDAGFYNIDIDASTLVDIDKKSLLDQQVNNGKVTAEMTQFIRSIQPKGITVSVGGEIGEIGAGNSTVEDLRAFMTRYREILPPGMKGISKISVQTGTTHGGIALPDGTIAKVKLDFDTLEKLSKLAKTEYKMGGAVQHGASTLPDEMFDMFPKVGTLEVHLATGFQNIVFDSPNFPKSLMEQIQAGLEGQISGRT